MKTKIGSMSRIIFLDVRGYFEISSFVISRVVCNLMQAPVEIFVTFKHLGPVVQASLA